VPADKQRLLCNGKAPAGLVWLAGNSRWAAVGAGCDGWHHSRVRRHGRNGRGHWLSLPVACRLPLFTEKQLPDAEERKNASETLASAGVTAKSKLMLMLALGPQTPAKTARPPALLSWACRRGPWPAASPAIWKGGSEVFPRPSGRARCRSIGPGLSGERLRPSRRLATRCLRRLPRRRRTPGLRRPRRRRRRSPWTWRASCPARASPRGPRPPSPSGKVLLPRRSTRNCII